MHTTIIRATQSLGIFHDRAPSRWRTRLRSILNCRWIRKNEEAKPNSLCRLGDRLLADVGLYREHGVHHPENRADHRWRSPVPVALLAIWMPPV